MCAYVCINIHTLNATEGEIARKMYLSAIPNIYMLKNYISVASYSHIINQENKHHQGDKEQITNRKI